MRGGRSGRQVGAKVELRPEEDNSEEQRQNANSLSLGLHVLTKTKLRLEWLRGQVNPSVGEVPCWQPNSWPIHPTCYGNV